MYINRHAFLITHDKLISEVYISLAHTLHVPTRAHTYNVRRTHTYTLEHIRVHTYTDIHICTHTPKYIYIYIYIYLNKMNVAFLR